jgi:hypothetical protein
MTATSEQPGALTADTIALATAQQQLRQEQETFEQRKKHDARWFVVRCAIGWVAVVTLPVILIAASLIVWHHSSFDVKTVNIATTALVVDALATAGSLYKLVLGDQGKQALTPVTRSTQSSRKKP